MENITISLNETFSAAAGILLIPQRNLLRSIVLLGKDRDPITMNTIWLEDVIWIYGNVCPFWTIAFDFRG